ncbi:MAG TPA: pyroglutamyl-peptidase I [Stellaceae bacterium]|nr:pyroglutamyl-peptidase I [Stellaceae bacterium]
MRGTALITGFEPYGGRDLNPSGELAAALDGARIGDLAVVGRTLPVVFAGLAERIEAYLAETRPSLVIALGLWPGEPAIRLERRAVNLAQWSSPDNAGALRHGEMVELDGAAELAATLPLPAIQRALIADGIPARLSDSAGTFLCNATLYTLLHTIARDRALIPCGFIHLPYLPRQAATMLADARDVPRDAELASMDLATMERAVRIALAVTASRPG